ncbi:VOC family protein [Bacillus sp. B15-48]|uniref:VOC family protein n=1 Tax=Bacillus sp. B15-48 TaxID=1548601 RepID=UPI00193F5FC9|nr:VOC family protein [Bacillus sp. B15-48]
MAALKWDHVVHYVNDLDESIRVFTDNGLAAFHGGSHVQWGTYNALSYFGLTYIEFLGIENRTLVEQTDSTHVVVKDSLSYLPEQEAFSRVALRTDDIDELAVSLRAHGLKLSPIMDSKRVNAKGELIEWRMMTIQGDFHGLPYPFIIQWKGTDADRLESMTKSGTIQPHPAGETEIQEAVFYVKDAALTAKHWSELFGLNKVASSEEGEATLQIGEQSFIFKNNAVVGLKQLVFQTESEQLTGKTITIGEGEYRF